MGVPKGTDNFKEHRKAKVQSNLRLIRDVLERARKRKQTYDTISVLVADVEDRTKIHRTTLKRNPQYAQVLLDHLAAQPGASTTVSDEDAPPELLRSKLIDAKLDAKIMRTRISTLEAELAAIHSSTVLPLSSEQSDWHLAFSHTATLLRLVLDTVNNGYEHMRVNINNGEILDLSAPPGRQLIASGERTKSFIEFYRKLLTQEGKLKDKGGFAHDPDQ